MQVRPLRTADLAAVVAIDAAASAYPWSKAKFIESHTPDAPCFVLESDGRLIGFAVYSQVLDEASLLNIAIEPGSQGRGAGRLLLDSSLSILRVKASQCFLEVRESNAAAIHLYRQLGFKQVGERRDYYPAAVGRENALVMRLQLNSREDTA